MSRSIYTRPDKPRQLQVKRRKSADTVPAVVVPELLVVDSSTECHVTPAEVAQRMGRYLLDGFDYLAKYTFLEPSAGTGALVSAMLSAGACEDQITMIDKHMILYQRLWVQYPEAKAVNSCFLEYSKQGVKFDFILMNPPFRQIKQHMEAAIGLLSGNGRLVALVPTTYQNDEAETLEVLSSDTFGTAKVHTKIITIN